MIPAPKTRYRLQYRWFRPALVVIQINTGTLGSGQVAWRDAQPEDLINGEEEWTR